jgi:tripartite-type tricarboxylate transporter receptor subunit TctC
MIGSSANVMIVPVSRPWAAGVTVRSVPAMQENLKKLGVEALPMAPVEMDDLVKRETAATTEVIKAAGIKP